MSDLPELPEPHDPPVFGYTSADMRSYAKAYAAAAVAKGRKPLTDEQIRKLWIDTTYILPHCDHYLHFARALEEAKGSPS